ncbi:MAG: O-methyltransferase [Chloroflexi bacterium]|nr:O-methyltransferase [Chloroflexota bacterium]
MTTPHRDYVRAVSGPRSGLLDEILRDALLERGLRPMQVDDNAAKVLQLLTHVLRPRHVLEIGTYFGYSTIHLARGLPEGGRVTSLELDLRHADLAVRNLERAGVADRVDVVVGPAADHLATMEPESVDLLFIDADKRSYPEYLKLCFGLVRSGGLLLADDAFVSGDYGPERGSDDPPHAEARAITTYNRAVLRSPRLLSAFIGTDTGLMVSYKA